MSQLIWYSSLRIEAIGGEARSQRLARDSPLGLACGLPQMREPGEDKGVHSLAPSHSDPQNRVARRL
jgi:hypothetical protein